MTELSKKSFDELREDYAFFAEHTTEFAQDLYHYQQTLAQFHIPEKPLKFLDFGCGNGVFTSQFLDLLNMPPHELGITLVEPDEVYRQNAVHVLSPYSELSIADYPHLPAEIKTQFHLILSNHVLYYVPALEQTVTQLLNTLHPQGALLIAMAGKGNIISQFWQKCFDRLGQPIPYYLAEDLVGILEKHSPNYQCLKVDYELCFPDTEANRWKLLRFMLGSHLEHLPRPESLALFEPYVSQGQVQITTHHEQFIVRSRGVLPSPAPDMVW